MMRLIAPALLVIVVGLVPLAVTHAQSAAITAQREADRASAKTNRVWTQTQGEAKERWRKLTDDDMQEFDGRREVLIGRLQTRYAISFEDASAISRQGGPKRTTPVPLILDGAKREGDSIPCPDCGTRFGFDPRLTPLDADPSLLIIPQREQNRSLGDRQQVVASIP